MCEYFSIIITFAQYTFYRIIILISIRLIQGQGVYIITTYIIFYSIHVTTYRKIFNAVFILVKR